MKNNIKKYAAATTKTSIVSVLILGTSISWLSSFAPTNFFKSYDAVLNAGNYCSPANKSCDYARKNNFSLALFNIETGQHRQSFNGTRNHVGIFQLHETTQSSLAMLQNSTIPAAQTLLAQITMLGLGAPGGADNGTRGKLMLTGHLREVNTSITATCKIPQPLLPGSIGVEFFLPIVYKRINNTAITTKPVYNVGANVIDAFVQNNLTNPLINTRATFGDLTISDWEKTGTGDLTGMLTWYYKRHCGSAHAGFFTRIGCSAPTSIQRNVDAVFSMPLGNDGAWGIPASISLFLKAQKYITLGIDGQLLYLFDKTKDYRMKTDINQTEFLLINKGRATKKHGLLFDLHSYISLTDLIDGMAFTVGWSYTKHEHDSMKIFDDRFNETIVNTLGSLKAWDVHNAIFKLHYNFCFNDKQILGIGAYYKKAIAGSRIIDTNTIGGHISLRF